MLASKKEVRRAGVALVDLMPGEPGYEENLSLIMDWRSAHLEPLQVAFSRLERIASQNASFVITSRLKRTETIIDKLKRPGSVTGSRPNVTTFRDIAGCRLIVPSMKEVESSVEQLLQYDDVDKGKIRDYIANPQGSGYRSVHLYNRIDAPQAGFTGLHVETQVRTLGQHAWAVAVEMYDRGAGTRLKFGEGEPGPRRFFSMASQLLGAIENGGAIRDVDAIVTELQVLDRRHCIVDVLRAINDSVFPLGADDFEQKNEGAYYLIRVDFERQQSSLRFFEEDQSRMAVDQYVIAEEQKEPLEDVLLAKASSVKALKTALPNYFANATQFIDILAGYGIA